MQFLSKLRIYRCSVLTECFDTERYTRFAVQHAKERCLLTSIPACSLSSQLPYSGQLPGTEQGTAHRNHCSSNQLLEVLILTDFILH